MTQRATIQTTVQHQAEEGARVYCQTPPVPMVLTGYRTRSLESRVVASTETGLALDVTGAVAIVVQTQDNAFSYKLNAADTSAPAKTRGFSHVGYDVADGTMGVDVAPVLIGNGTTQAIVDVWTFYK